MNEEFLHYIWKFRLFDSKSLYTDKGEILEIIKTGEHNTNGGPDFHLSRIKIGNTVWAGNIEIHINASDWKKHKHHKDKSYDNIILHVVYNNDFTALRENNESIPVLELKELISNNVLLKYNKLVNSKEWIPCQNMIKRTDSVVLNSWIDRLLVERLEKKAGDINLTLKNLKNNWEYAFYLYLSRNFGFKINSEPFEMLAKSTSLSCLAKHKNNLLQLEAMLFGQAGLLKGNINEKYSSLLKQEYSVLKQKFSFSPINGHLWKFMRLNPSGFPTIRIAQFAALINKTNNLFSGILEARKLNDIENLFDVECSEYWQTHYIFGKDSPKRSKRLGKSAIENIIINTVVPFLFVYGQKKNEEKYKDRAIRFLEQLEGEKNSIITKWKLLGMYVNKASNTQALLELKNNYCNYKQCLSCNIGIYLLKKT